jgi:Na+/H+-dicarboxylate symporter
MLAELPVTSLLFSECVGRLGSTFAAYSIVTTFLAVVLGMIAWLDRAWIGK